MAEKGMTMAEFLQNTTQEQRNEIYNASASGNSEKVKQLTSNIGSNRGSGQGTSAASRGSSGSSTWKKGSIPKGFVKNPLAFAGGIKPVDTRPSVVSTAREPFEYAAQQRQKEAEIQDLNQKYKQAYLDYNSARRAVTAASKGKSTANYDVAKRKMTEASELVDAYKKRVEEAGGTLWTPTNWLDTVKWGARAGLTSADSAIAKGLDWMVGGFADELRTLAGVTANDISPALADSAANLATKAGRLINPNYTYGENNFLKQYVEEGNRRINVQHEEATRAASDSKAAQTVGKYTEMIMNSLPMSAMALLSGGTTAAAQATTEALQAASTLANSSRAAQIVTPILKATTDMAKDPNWGFTFMSVVGDSYENALADGASEDQASLYAILNAAYNATTEIGGSDEMLGGLQKLPKNIRDALERADNSVLLQIIKGIPSEIGEEIVQGIGESGLKSTYKNVPMYSATDEGAMINPSRMKDEALGAAVVSAVLGGGQSAIGAGTYAIENGIAQRQYRNKVAQAYGGSAAELVERGLESAPGTKSRTLAEAYKAKLDSGKSLTPRELTNLVKANEEAIRAESAAENNVAQEVNAAPRAPSSPAQTQSVTEEQTPVQTAASTQTAEKAPTGVYEAKYKGQTGDVVAFARQNDSFALRIKMPDGSKPDVMESQVTLDPATKKMLDTVRPYDYGDEILTSYRAAENGDNFKLFTQAFTTVADLYGKETTVTAEQAYADSVKNGGAATVLTREQFNKAFDIGRSSRDARVVNTAARQRGSGNVYFNKVVDFGGARYAAATEDMVSADELSVIKTIAKTAGVDVVFYQSETDMSGRYVGANGFMRNGTMYLDVNAGATKTTEQSAVLLTAAHELTHYIRENNAEGYAQLRDFVTQHLIENGVGIEKLAEQKIKRENGLLSMDEAVEEVIADSCETMLEDTKFPELMAKENPGLCEQIRDWLADFTEKLRRAFSGVKARHEEARAMLNYAEELHELWDNALVAAVRNTETASGTEESNQTGWVRNSSRENSTNTTGIKEQIEENRDRLNSMDVVAVATVPTDLGNFDAVTAWAMKELKRTGYAVDKPGFGRIIFDERQIRNGVKYAKTPAEKAAFAVLDKVLKRGVEIGAHGNHKNREKETVTFAAPVELNNIRGNMAVVVNRRGNTYYAHRIVLPDGTEFRFTEKKDAVQGPKRGVTRTGSLAESTSTTSENNIPQPVEESNTKYSMRDVGLDDTAEQRRGRQESYADLRRRNAELERRVEYWKGQSRTSKAATVRQTDTDAFARQLMNDAYNSDRETLGKVKDSLKGLGDYIVQSRAEDLDYGTIHEIATETADMILQGSYTTIDDTNADNREQLHDYLHSTKLAMNEREMLDLPEGWRQKNRVNIKLSKDGLPVDTAYGELQGMFGEGTFPSDITSQADMLQRIADVERAWRPVKANPFTEYMAEMRENMAQEIIDTMLSDEIRQTPPTAMDRAVARETERVAGERRKNRELQQRIAQVQQEGIERTRKAVQDERRYQLQRQERAQKVKNIEKMTTRWAKQLTDNTGKSHIPDALKQPIGQLIRSIDPTTKYTTAKGSAALADRLRRVGDALEKQQKYNMGDTTEGGADVYIDLPPEIGSRLREYAKDIEDAASIRREWKLEDMDLQELAELEDMLTSVRDSLKNANELYSMNMKADALGDETVKYLNKLPAKTKAAKGAEKFLGYTNQTPVYFFKRFGTGGEKVFKSLADGWEDFAFKAKAIQEFAEALYNSKEVREAEQTIVQVQLHDKLANGLTNEETVPVYMTKAQIMCLYGATLRGEAALNHILGAGITLTNIKQPHGKGTITQSDNYLTTAEELESIINDNLSEREKEIVRGMIKFMSTTCANWGNAVSQKRWGINLFTEDSYWPISTDSRSRDVKSGEAAGSSTSMYRLANMGFTKPLTPGSKNPMVIGSAFDVFANHTSDMAKYGSMVLPILDAMKWINYSATMETSGTQYTTASVRKAMDRAYGEDAQNYFVKLMRDLNGSKEGGRYRNDIFQRLTTRYKAQAVGANLRVILLQPTAYARAGMVIDLKHLAAGELATLTPRKEYAEMLKYSGIALWKDMGFRDININSSIQEIIKQDKSWVDRVVDKSMFFAEKFDQWTWLRLWRGCKRTEQDKARKTGEKLTHEELMRRTSDLFQSVIYQTQVVDSTLTRSQIMREEDTGKKMVTSFMAEPTLTYNTLANIYLEFEKEKGTSDSVTAWKKCSGKMARGFAVYVAQAALGAIVESAVDAGRDDDEYMTFVEKWLEKFLGEDSFFEGNLWGELSLMGKLPNLKDVVSIFQGDDRPNRMDLNALYDLYQFLETSKTKAAWLFSGEEDTSRTTTWGWIYQGLKALSELTGIPGYSLTRDVISLWNTAVGQRSDLAIKTYKPRPESEIKNAYLKGYLTDEEAKELLMDAKTMGDNVYYEDHRAKAEIAAWTDKGETYKELFAAMENDDINAYNAALSKLTEDEYIYKYDAHNKAKDQIKEWYAGDKRGKIVLAKEQTIAMLQKYVGMTAYDAKVTAQQWTCKQQEGFDYSQRKALFLAGDIDFDKAVEVITTYGKDDNGKLFVEYEDKAKAKEYAEKEVQKWQMVLDTGIDYDSIKSAFYSGEITKEQVKEYLEKYGGVDEKKATDSADLYEWKKENDMEETKATVAQFRRYEQYISGAGIDISAERYYSYIEDHTADDFHGAPKPGSTSSIPYSKRNKVWEYIDSLPLTSTEKDAMARCYAADNSNEGMEKPTQSWLELEDAPWNN